MATDDHFGVDQEVFHFCLFFISLYFSTTCFGLVFTPTRLNLHTHVILFHCDGAHF